MPHPLLTRQDELSCPQINGETIVVDDRVFKVQCDWVAAHGNCSTYTGVEDCLYTCLGNASCSIVTINPTWQQGCCTPPGLAGEVYAGFLTAWDVDKVEGPPSGLPASMISAAAGTITIENKSILSSTSSSSTISSSSTSAVSSTSPRTSASPKTAPSSSSSSSLATLTPSLSSSAPSAQAKQSHTGLSTGAQAGIGVGVGLVGLAALVCALYIAFRFGKKKQRQAGSEQKEGQHTMQPT